MTREPKKLTQKQPSELFKTELPPPELKQVELKPNTPIHVEVGFWEAFWLLIKSIVRNKARDAMEGKEIGIPINPLKLFTAVGGWWKSGVVVLLLITLLTFRLNC